MPRIPFTCAECGAEGYCYPSQQRTFCSTKCAGLRHGRTGMPSKPRRGRISPCGTCGVDVYRAPRFRDDQAVYCSPACHNEGQRVERVERVCRNCQTHFWVQPSFATRQSAIYCSRLCMGLDKIKRPLDRQHNGKPARLDGHGYVLVWEPDHHNARVMKGWVYEHRLVAERAIGRPLTPKDEVHHINRDKADNRPENLSVLDGETHALLTAAQRMSDAKLLAEYIARFGPLTT